MDQSFPNDIQFNFGVEVTDWQCLLCRFFSEKGFEHIVLLSADGALEAVPAMGAADIILDLVSTGVTLRENNLKELKGADVLLV